MSALFITKAGFQLLLDTEFSLEFNLEKQANPKTQPLNTVAYKQRHFSTLRRLLLS